MQTKMFPTGISGGLCRTLGALILSGACLAQGQTNIAPSNASESAYAIVLPADASASEKFAAGELQAFLGKSLALAVVGEDDPRAARPGRIFLGFGRAAEKALARGTPVDPGKFGDEGFILRTVAGNKGEPPDLVIAGGRPRGTLYGVYTFLDRLGFRWYTDRVTRFPEPQVTRWPDLDEEGAPPFL